MKRKKYKKIELQDRDIRMLKFIWRWKAVKGPWLHHIYFSGKSGSATTKRLTSLQAAGLTKSYRPHEYRIGYWSITPRGPEHIIDLVGPLESKVPESESPVHDLICSAVQFGPWQTDAPKGAGLLSEQQLRSCDLSRLPSWVPHDLYHRPNGYWRRGWRDDPDTISLEVELHPKSNRWCRKILNQYICSDSISFAVWVIGQRLIVDRVTKISQELGAKFNQRMTDSQASGCLKIGIVCTFSQQKKWHSFMAEFGIPQGYIGGKPIYPRYYFDTSRFPIKSTDYKPNEKSLGVNCIRI